MSTGQSYELIRRSLQDAQFVAALEANPTATLRAAGVAEGPELNELLRIFELMSVGARQQTGFFQKMEKQYDDTLDVAKEMKKSLKLTLEQIDQAFRSSMLMYQISFYLGVLLILAALVQAMLGRDPLLPAIFGALGIADVLVFFLVKPQERLQSSRASLAQLQAALYNWFMDSVNMNTLMNEHHKRGDLAAIAAVSASLMDHTDKTLGMLQKYCKLAES